jgi:hypothetical protein
MDITTIEGLRETQRQALDFWKRNEETGRMGDVTQEIVISLLCEIAIELKLARPPVTASAFSFVPR